MRRWLTAVAGVALMGGQAMAQMPDAAASDPVKLGWMQGLPPAPDKRVSAADGSAWKFPQLRWTFSHWRMLYPTVGVSRGAGPIATLPEALRTDLDAVSFTPLGGGAAMTWRQAFDANYTDGVVVLHRGRIVYERYGPALDPAGEHIAMSVTKSFIGTLAEMLIAEGKLDRAAKVGRYIPEATGAFADATVGEVMEMTTALKYNEDYTGGDKSFLDFALAWATAPRRPDYAGPASGLLYAAAIAKDGVHGEAFTYRTPNTDMLGWIVARIEGKPLAQVISDRIWSKLGAEGDAYMHVDPTGAAFAGGGLNTRLRDLARFGEMIRQNGQFNGQQIVPAAVVARIRQGGDPKKFAGYPTLPGWSYGSQWWHAHDAHGVFMARGIHGQAIYIDPRAEVVIARYASHHIAGNRGIDPLSLPAYRAIADKLLADPR